MNAAPGESPQRSRWTAVAGGLLGVGVTSLLAAIGFGVFARTHATRAHLPVRNSGWDSSTPGFAAVTAVLAAVFVLTAVVIAVVNRRWLPLAAVAGIFAPGMLALCGLPRYYRIMVDAYLPAQLVPAARLAWTFAVVGAISVLLAACCALVRRTRPRWPSACVGVAAALVAGAAFSAVVMGDANPDRMFTATTAPILEVPPVPDAVTGAARFSVRVQDYDATVRAAGPGFVVRAPDGVRGYGADGRQRWEYLGSTPWRAAHLGVFDDGRTIVVDFDSGAHEAGQLVGLDADTGQRLWRHDYGPSVWEFRGQLATLDGVAPRHFMVQSGSTLERIDTRTGEPMWSIRRPDLRPELLFATAAGIGYFGVNSEQGGGEAQARYVVLDPATGERRSDIALGVVATRDWAGGLDPQVAGGVGIVFGDDESLRYLNAVTGGVWPIDTAALIGDGAEDGDFLTFSDTVMGGRRVALHDGADGRVRCDIAVPRDVTAAVWLPEVVLLGDEDGVAAYRRADCAALPELEADHGVADLVVAPGVVLVLERGRGETTITGYGHG